MLQSRAELLRGTNRRNHETTGSLGSEAQVDPLKKCDYLLGAIANRFNARVQLRVFLQSGHDETSNECQETRGSRTALLEAIAKLHQCCGIHVNPYGGFRNSDRLRVMFAATALPAPGIRDAMARPVRESTPFWDSEGWATSPPLRGRIESGSGDLMAASTSRRVIRPLSPEPRISPRSTPCSRAMRLLPEVLPGI